ncbi:MAG: hypothetical protein K6347_00720 [Campylobacterales bacterium]
MERRWGLKTIVLVWLMVLFFAGCNNHYERQQMRIAANPWVGYFPLAYAQAKGWIDQREIKIVWTVGLSQSLSLYNKGLVDAFAGTQYEWMEASNHSELAPYLLFNRSYGADMILSNIPFEKLKAYQGPIEVCLEEGGVTANLFEAFIREKKLTQLQTIKRLLDQEAILRQCSDATPRFVVIYEPYASVLKSKGYRLIASTATLKTFYVIDALFASNKLSPSQQLSMKKVQEAFRRGLKALREDPHDFYKTIKGFLLGQEYQAFMASLEGIKWLDRGDRSDVLIYLEKYKMDLSRLER